MGKYGEAEIGMVPCATVISQSDEGAAAIIQSGEGATNWTGI